MVSWIVHSPWIFNKIFKIGTGLTMVYALLMVSITLKTNEQQAPAKRVTLLREEMLLLQTMNKRNDSFLRDITQPKVSLMSSSKRKVPNEIALNKNKTDNLSFRNFSPSSDSYSFLKTTKLDTGAQLRHVIDGPKETPKDVDKWYSFLNTEYRNAFKFELVPFEQYSLNATLTQMVPVLRDIPETRLPQCFSYTPKPNLPNVSIVIPFHNEQYSLLVRTLHSILNRTPHSLIHEIILVDDASTNENLIWGLPQYLKHMPFVRLYRTRAREGLIRSRLLGSMLATGEVLVFLDAHVECQKFWLQPLLEIVAMNKSRIAIPATDLIDPKTLDLYFTGYNDKGDSMTVLGSFDWELNYVWVVDPYPDPKRSPLQPVKTATIIGCAIVVNREHFFQLGAFDEDMYIWGGENLEISFRAWMCGAGIYMAPCSHVGHIFRTKLPYHFPNVQQVQLNLQRLAKAWMDDYADIFYKVSGSPLPVPNSQVESLQTRKDLRSHLQCHDFKWYMDTMGENLPHPMKEDTHFGQLSTRRGCVTVLPKEIGIYDCVYHIQIQNIYWSSHTGLLRYTSGLCLNYNLTTLTIQLGVCDQKNPLHLWKFTGQYKGPGELQLQHGGHKHCLANVKDYVRQNREAHYILVLLLCNESIADEMQWTFTHAVK